MTLPWLKPAPQADEPSPVRPWVQLRAALLCLNDECEAIYQAEGGQTCPRCGSHEAFPLARALDRRTA